MSTNENDEALVQVLGLSTTSASGPVEPFWINLEPGLVVVYGKNGSGKTALLRRISEAGTQIESTLYLRSSAPDTWETSEPTFWERLHLGGQELHNGFHDGMFHFLDWAQRHDFTSNIERMFFETLILVVEALQEKNLSAHELIESQELVKIFRKLLQPELRWGAEIEIPASIRRESSLIELLAYRSELFIQDEEFQQLVVGMMTIDLNLKPGFAINNDKLFWVGDALDSFAQLIDEIKAEITAAYSVGGTEGYDFAEAADLYGGLGISVVDWLESGGHANDPWNGLKFDTGVTNPVWGRVVADVDLDAQYYGTETDRQFSVEFCDYLKQLRYDLPEDDPDHLDNGNNDGWSPLFSFRDGGIRWYHELDGLVEEIQESANRLFKQFLDFGPPLVCAKSRIQDIGNSSPFAWRVVIDSETAISLSDLSWAEQRLASLAIRLATPSKSPPVRLLIIDEPERGLHRRAERRFAHAIRDTCEQMDITIVVGTHSPHFLGLPDARLHHLRKTDPGHSILESLPNLLEPYLEELGMTSSDLLQLTRRFLVVEGEHDAVILTEFFGDEFEKHGVRILPLRGLRNLTNATDASFIFRYTDASIVYLTDNEDYQRVEEIWQRALTAEITQRPEILAEYTAKSNSAEGQFLKEFTSLAIQFSSRDRISFSALSAPDILDYLPVEYFIPGISSWEELRNEWTRTGGKNFKTWLQREYGVDFNTDSIKGCIQLMDNIPAELAHLFDRLISI